MFGIPIKAKRAGLKHNNNHIERYNQDINDRIKTMRNFSNISETLKKTVDGVSSSLEDVGNNIKESSIYRFLFKGKNKKKK